MFLMMYRYLTRILMVFLPTVFIHKHSHLDVYQVLLQGSCPKRITFILLLNKSSGSRTCQRWAHVYRPQNQVFWHFLSIVTFPVYHANVISIHVCQVFILLLYKEYFFTAPDFSLWTIEFLLTMMWRRALSFSSSVTLAKSWNSGK